MALWEKKKNEELEQMKAELRKEVMQEVKEEIKKEQKEKIKQELKKELENELKTPGEKAKEKLTKFGETMAKGLGGKASIFNESDNKVNRMLGSNKEPVKKETIKKGNSINIISEDNIRRMLK